jgi:GNAT superfamily N-acetyltransferase
MKEKSEFRIRSMSLNDLPAAMNLSSSEGWNQTEKDWRIIVDNPANICLVIEAGNRIIGSSTAVNYNDKLAWIGMVLIDKDFRGQGAGKLILNNLLDKLKNFESVKLDSTSSGHPLYLKSGFVDEFIINRMTTSSLNIQENISGVELIAVEDLHELAEFDKDKFGIDRTPVLRTFLRNNPGKGLMLRRNNKVSGFVLGREGIRFNYVGPVYAQTTADAKVLISAALKSLKNRSAALDIPEDKADLTAWLQSAGFSIQRQFVRMYLRSNNYCGNRQNQYAISGPEFG